MGRDSIKEVNVFVLKTFPPLEFLLIITSFVHVNNLRK